MKRLANFDFLDTMRVTDAFTPLLIARGRRPGDGQIGHRLPAVPADAQLRGLVSRRARLHGGAARTARPRRHHRDGARPPSPPPAVATAGQDKVNSHALPLDGFLDEVTELISADPTPPEVLVEGVHMHR